MNGDLISRSALLKELCNSCDGWCDNTECDCLNCKSDHRCDMVVVIAESPAVDAVEVVRCKDCIFREEPHIYGRSVIGELWCRVIGVPMNLDDFCSYGERRC